MAEVIRLPEELEERGEPVERSTRKQPRDKLFVFASRLAQSSAFPSGLASLWHTSPDTAAGEGGR